MTIEKERISKDVFLPPWVISEHQARFEFGTKFCAHKKVVDCACGPGIGTKIFFGAKPQKIWAFDLSTEAIKVAKKLNLADVEFIVADATKLPLQNEAADVYISFETIEHLPKDQFFLSEVARVLKIGGTFLCSTPNRDVTNPGTTITNNPYNKFHLREYSAVEFQNLLKKYFTDIQLYGQNKQNILKVKLLTWVGKNISAPLAVKINQILKLPGFIWKNSQIHQVVPVKDGEYYEYLVAVCKKQGL